VLKTNNQHQRLIIKSFKKNYQFPYAVSHPYIRYWKPGLPGGCG
jgi:hypothetical protein